MAHTLVALNPNDIPVLAKLATELEDVRVAVFDVALVDRVAAEAIGPIDLVEWPNAPSYASRHDDARRSARALERRLDAIVEPLWPGLHLPSWQHASLYYLHMALGWFAGLFESTLPQLQGRKLIVPLVDNPQTYYLPSFIPALLLLQRAQAAGLTFQAYSYGRAADDTQRVPALHGTRTEGAPEFLLAHLPTCFYDGGHFNAELAASGKAVVSLAARYWDVPLAAADTVAAVDLPTMQATLDAATLARIEAVIDALAAPLDAHLSRWLVSPLFRTRQVEQLTAVYRAQLTCHALLERHFAQAKPSKLLLSDHDADFHGPLAAFARRHRLPVLVLPHSKTSPDLDLLGHNATVLSHAIQGEPVHDLDGQRLLQLALDLPATLQFSTELAAPARRVGLLLNGVSLNGVPSIDLAAYRQGLLRIVQWASERQLELIVRSRPGCTLFKPLLEAIGLSTEQMQQSTQGTMADFAQRCGLCLMYDAPTAGALELLQRGIAILNPVASSMTQRECATISAAIVPRGDVEAMLTQAAALVDDPLSMLAFRKRQFSAYVERCRDALPLRAFV